MKRIPVLLIASIFIFLLSACGKDTARTIAVEEINGTTHVTNQSGTMDVYVGQHLISGDDVKVETDSNMTLLIDMDKHLFADAGTHFGLEATGSGRNTQTKINLFEGSVLSGIDNNLKAGETYEVSTPNATMAVRGTVFQVICEKISDGNFITTVKVSEGSVEATTIENGETIVKTISAGNEGEFTGTASKIVKDTKDEIIVDETINEETMDDKARLKISINDAHSADIQLTPVQKDGNVAFSVIFGKDEVGTYSVSYQKVDPIESRLWQQTDVNLYSDLSSCEYHLEGDTICWHVDMSSYSDYSFYDVNEFTVIQTTEDIMVFSADDVVE